MKPERLKRFNIMNVVCVLLVIIIIILAISLKSSKASYRVTASYPAAYGTINWKMGDISVLAINLQQDDGTYSESDDFPTSGYVLNEENSYCTVSVDGEQVKQDVSMSYTNNTFTVTGLTKKGTKCFLYFDIDKCGTACNTILANNILDASRKSGEFTSTFTEDTSGIIFEGPADDYGDTTYFFAGANPNNWVYFAGFFWRIIRVNGNGSIRLIYNGTSTTTTGTTTQLSSITVFNSSSSDNAYVGYMYGTTGASTYAATHANTNSSSIKSTLDTWYQNNLSSYSDKIDTDVGFCGDRQPSTSITELNGSGGTGTTVTYYAPQIRVSTTHQFIYTCAVSSDLYTVSSSDYGNRALTYPIGLITTDEVYYAGGLAGYGNVKYWLYTGQDYWTITPRSFVKISTQWYASVDYVSSGGSLLSGSNAVTNTKGIRPVINIKSSTILSGLGTSSTPFIVSS